jgi:hypothetical protein
VLSRRHVVVVASPEDPGLAADAVAAGGLPLQVAAATMRRSRDAAVGAVRRAGAQVVSAPPDRLARACVTAYLRAKSRAVL